MHSYLYDKQADGIAFLASMPGAYLNAAPGIFLPFRNIKIC